METYKLVIYAVFYAAFGLTCVSSFNDTIGDYEALRRLKRWQRIAARLVIFAAWPVPAVITVAGLVLLVLRWLWSAFFK